MVFGFKRKFRYNESRKRDLILLGKLIAAFLLVMFFVSPPWNKFAHVCLLSNNTLLFFQRLVNHEQITEWMYHRNNVVYLMDMNDRQGALKEIDKAISLMSDYESEKNVNLVYHDRALVRLANNDYKGALSDYIRLTNYDYDVVDNFRIAMLFKHIGNTSESLKYCKNILTEDAKAYAGYVCYADVYSAAGRTDISLNIYDRLIKQYPNKALFYSDRAIYREKIQQHEASNEDRKKAKELNPNIDTTYSLANEMLLPKSIKLEKISI